MLPGSAIPEEDIRIFGHLCGKSRLCEFVRCGLDIKLECQYFNQRLVQCRMDCPSFGHPSLKAVKCDDINGIPTWRKLGYDNRICKYTVKSVHAMNHTLMMHNFMQFLALIAQGEYIGCGTLPIPASTTSSTTSTTTSEKKSAFTTTSTSITTSTSTTTSKSTTSTTTTSTTTTSTTTSTTSTLMTTTTSTSTTTTSTTTTTTTTSTTTSIVTHDGTDKISLSWEFCGLQSYQIVEKYRLPWSHEQFVKNFEIGEASKWHPHREKLNCKSNQKLFGIIIRCRGNGSLGSLSL